MDLGDVDVSGVDLGFGVGDGTGRRASDLSIHLFQSVFLKSVPV